MCIRDRFIMFIVGELVVTYGYLIIRKKTDNKFVYYLALFCSIIPLIITKVSVKTTIGPLGFIGLSYLNFKAIQMIIEIYDGTIKKVNFFTYIYFLLFFPTLSSGPIDRYRRFEENINTIVPKEEYINDYLYVGFRKIFIGLGYKFVLAYLINTLWLSLIHIY